MLYYKFTYLKNSAASTVTRTGSLLLSSRMPYYYYYFGVRCARPGESEDTLSVQRPQPHTTSPWKEEKDKTVGDKKERADHANPLHQGTRKISLIFLVI